MDSPPALPHPMSPVRRRPAENRYRHPVIRTFLHLVLRLACLLLLMVSASFGQISTAVLEGTVEDALGARIPDARVKLVSGITGAESCSITSHDGSFALFGIIPGPYSVNIEREGFSTAQISGITLNLGETKDFLIQLRVGPITETVRIDAAEITVDTSANALSTQISGRLAASLPLNGRSFEDIFTLTPGTLTDSPQSFESRSATRGGVAVNGQRSGMNRFFIDGVSANFGLLTSPPRANSQLRATPSPSPPWERPSASPPSMQSRNSRFWVPTTRQRRWRSRWPVQYCHQIWIKRNARKCF